MQLITIAKYGRRKVIHVVSPSTAFEIDGTDSLIMEEVVLPDKACVNEAKQI